MDRLATAAASLAGSTADNGDVGYVADIDAKICELPPNHLRRNGCAAPCGKDASSFTCVPLESEGASRRNEPFICGSQVIKNLGKCQATDYGCTFACYAAPPTINASYATYAFLVPFGSWRSPKETSLGVTPPPWWQRQVDELPRKAAQPTALISNDYLVQVEQLNLTAKFQSVNIAGGYSSEFGLKGKVSNVTLASDVFENSPGVSAVTLANLNLGMTTPGFASLLPLRLTKLSVFNCLLESFPSDLSRLTALTMLNMSSNYLTSVPSTALLPALTTLDLAQNNLTTFEAASLPRLQTLDLRANYFDTIPSGVFTLQSLQTLRLAANPLQLAAVTSDQFTFLSQLKTLELASFSVTPTCRIGEMKTLPTANISVCVTTEAEIEKLRAELGSPSSSSSDGSSTTAIVGIVIAGVVVLMVVAFILWKKRCKRRPNHHQKPVVDDVGDIEFVKLESEESGDSELQGLDASGRVATQARIARHTPALTPDQSNATTATHYLPTNSPLELTMLASHTNNSGNSSGQSVARLSSQGSATSDDQGTLPWMPLMRTLKISRSSDSFLLSSASLWDDGEMNSYQLKYEDIEDVRLIGSGGHGVVWLVRYRQSRLLASKRLVKDQLTRQKTFDFVAEIKLVAQLHHPSIVEFVGAAWTIETNLQALFEYMGNGDLRTYLDHTSPESDSRRRSLESPTDPDEPQILSWVHDKWQLALSIAEALVYVHSFIPALVHRDLKSRNVLLNDEMKAKLSDFGVSRFASDRGTMTAGVGTSKWLAPEVIAGSKSYDSSCDIYSFGVLLSELDTHASPYDDLRGDNGDKLPDFAILQGVAANSLKPTFSKTCPREILELAMACLSFDSSQRPTAVEVAFRLRTYARKHGFYVHDDP